MGSHQSAQFLLTLALQLLQHRLQEGFLAAQGIDGFSCLQD